MRSPRASLSGRRTAWSEYSRWSGPIAQRVEHEAALAVLAAYEEDRDIIPPALGDAIRRLGAAVPTSKGHDPDAYSGAPVHTYTRQPGEGE